MADKTVRGRWGGGLHFDFVSGLGGATTIDGDEGVAGTRASEALLVALGACTGSDVASILAKKRQSVTDYEVRVRGTQGDEHPRVFEVIDVLHVVEGAGVDADAVRRAIELSATRYCPVTAQLSSGDVVIHHRYRLVAAGAAAADVKVAETGPHGRIVVSPHGPGL